MSGRRGHLRLVPPCEEREAPAQQEAVLVYAGLDANARGADTEPVISANEIVAAQLEAIACGLRASIPHPYDRRAG